MNEFNVLLAAATNGTPSGSLFDALFARYIAPQDSWREFESPLPITILAAGEDLIDYRIYGNTVGGESVGERTENLYNKDDPDIVYSAYMDTYGIIRTGTYGDAVKVSGYIPINGGRTYIGTNLMNSGSGNFYSYYDANKQRMEGGVVSNNTVFDSPINAAYIRTTLIHRNIEDLSVVTEGSTAPTSYIPFGYKLPMVVTNGTTTTTTPIYIGSDPLAEDEYVDFGEQKIYRMVNGTLTPTDPPVPIPALPTIEGETIIDYNPSETSAVEPKKMYIKYKPQ